MTCKDCIHDGVCHLQEMSTGLELEEYIKEFGCEDFKNKADFVKVVRCKDCKYYKATGRLGEFDESMGVCKKEVSFYDDEPKEVLSVDFCSGGKKVQK